MIPKSRENAIFYAIVAVTLLVTLRMEIRGEFFEIGKIHLFIYSFSSMIIDFLLWHENSGES